MNFAKGFGLGVLVSYAVTATGMVVLLTHAIVKHTDEKETNINRKAPIYYGYSKSSTKFCPEQ